MFDVAIIGAGPAGSTLAHLIAHKYRVLLIDKRDLNNENNKNPIVKCCGGLLAPDAQHIMATIGLALPRDVLVDPQLFTVRTMDFTNNIERFYQRFYLNMDREKFDRWLVSQVPGTVEKRFNSMFKSFKKLEEGYEVKYNHGGKTYTERAKIIIGADGGNSRIRKIAFKEETFPSKYISIQEWFKVSELMPYFIAIFDESITDFYSWIIPKDEHVLLGAALKLNDNTNGKFELLKEKLKKHGFNLENRLKREGAYIYRPTSLSHVVSGNENIALIGEAAGAISPSSAEGFSYAFKSALYLAESLEDGIDGFLDRYQRKMKKIKMNILLKNLKSPAMYNPIIRGQVMRSGIQSMDVIKK
ncbi:FAD-binding protein [Wukongibacter baidiensis]|uniref:FAD-binding protein n=1 Tax=Wukongibacter baidiensis TaxID=1723361 RepID=UPI003D7FABE6